MARYFLLLVLHSAMFAALRAHADGFFHQLPNDGAWAEYELSELNSGKPYIIRMSSVGTVMHNGIECRWIETKLSGGEGRGRFNYIVKLLIPTKHLRPGVRSPAHIVKGYCGVDSDVILTLKDAKMLDAFEAESTIPLAGLVMPPPPLKITKRLDAVVVDLPFGLVKSKGVIDTTRLTIGALKGDFKVTFFTNLDPKAPFGVASVRIAVTDRILKDGTVEKVLEPIVLNFTLKDFGEGASSELP